MKLKCQIIFFTLLLGLAGCFEDDNFEDDNTEELTSEQSEQPAFSSADVDRRLETVIDNLEEEDESIEEEDVPLEDVPLDEYLEEEPEEFIEDEEYEPLPEED